MDTVPRHRESDHLAIGALLLLIGGIRIVVGLVEHQVFGGEATVALLAVVFGVSMLVRGK